MRTPLFIFILAFALTGCNSVWDPTFMPGAYKRTNEVYKTAPGPAPKNIGYNFSHEKNAEVLEIWRIVARDLVDTLEERAGLGPQHVYVHAINNGSAFYNAYDHIIREELRDRGYVLIANPDEKLQLSYEAFLPEMGENAAGDAPIPESEMGLKDYIFKITAIKNNALVGHASGIYRVPSYGYEPLDLTKDTRAPITLLPAIDEQE